MLTTQISRQNKTVSAGHLPYSAYKSALAIAEALNGKIGKTEQGGFKATFNSVEQAKKFVAQWTQAYEDNRKVEAKPSKTEISKKSKSKSNDTTNNFVVVTVNGKEFLVDASALVPTKAKAPSSSKKTTTEPKAKKTSSSKAKATTSKGKGKAFDFSKIKGKTNTDKNKALHKALVGMGLRDSNAPEYKAIWSARPW